MNLNLKSFTQLVQEMATALQSAASSLIDVSAGSVARAIFEANAGIALWMQWLVLRVLSMTRASTSNGADLDSWMADFGLVRLSAVSSTGFVTVSRFASAGTALVPENALVKSYDGTTAFRVIADRRISSWNEQLNGYVLPDGVAQLDVPIQCAAAGAVGNVLAGAITIIASSVPGVDTVTNTASLTNGLDVESDDAFRARFQSYIAGLSKATVQAVSAAVSGVQQGLSFAIEENVDLEEVSAMGSFLVIVDDGSGCPPGDLLAAVAAAVDSVRPIGTTFHVVPPSVTAVDVTLTISVEPGSPPPGQEAVSSAIAEYINSRPIGGKVSVTRTAQCVYNRIPSVFNISNILLNHGDQDLAGATRSVFRAGHLEVLFDVG